MKAVCWFGRHDVRVREVREPQLLNPRDAIVRISSTAICGSDLHLYDGHVPGMREGDVLGHEFMGEVVAVGSRVEDVKAGDRVVVPFAIACGACDYCQRELFSLCDNSNPNAPLAAAVHGDAGAGLFGHSHVTGGYAGGQAELARVPFADVGLLKVPPRLGDDQALLLSDVLPTAYQAVEQCGIRPGDVVAIWGCGPVGQLAIRCAFLMGAARVIAIDDVQPRLRMARDSGADPVDFTEEEVGLRLREMTGGRGPDACVDGVGFDQRVVRQAIQACRKGGVVSLAGAYDGLVDGLPLGSAFAKAVTLRTGLTHVQKYMRPLLQLIEEGKIDPSRVITHSVPLEFAPEAYEMFKKKQDGCVKVVLKP